jgi:glycerate 2-kinase
VSWGKESIQVELALAEGRMNDRETATDIFLSGVESVKPDRLIARFVQREGAALRIDGLNVDLDRTKNIYVLGAGKASASMAQAVETALGSRITAGHIVTKYGHGRVLKHIGMTEAGHPVPDENGLKGTAELLALAEKAEDDDLVIFLISGGGSALLADVPSGCSLADLTAVNDAMLKCGAAIHEINCVRKHLSRVKGGQLASVAYPATIISLILSDVIGDPLDVIASGPTTPDPTTFDEALAILNRYDLTEKTSARIVQVLQDGLAGRLAETPKNGDGIFQKTHNVIIGSNRLALEQARQRAEELGLAARVITNSLAGDVVQVARFIFEQTQLAQAASDGRPACLLFGGEPTAKVRGGGLGGRNQHLALLLAQLITGTSGMTILVGGSDGNDGPTDAAGAVVDEETSRQAVVQNCSIDRYLADCDSYHFFKKVGGHVVTGPTQTNVMDLIVAIVHGHAPGSA